MTAANHDGRGGAHPWNVSQLYSSGGAETKGMYPRLYILKETRDGVLEFKTRLVTKVVLISELAYLPLRISASNR